MVAGRLNGITERIFVQRLLGKDHGLALGVGGNVLRIVSLMCASHMEQAIPPTSTVVWNIFVPSFKIVYQKQLAYANFHPCEKPPFSGSSAKIIRPAAAAVKVFLYFPGSSTTMIHGRDLDISNHIREQL